MELLIESIKMDWPVLLPIFICSILVVAVVIQKWSYYSKNKRDIAVYMRELNRELESNDLRAAQDTAIRCGGIIGEVIEEAVRIFTEQKNGKTILDDKGNFAFTEKDWETAVDFYIRMVDKKVIPQIENFKKVNIEKGEYAGAVAWVSDAINYFDSTQKNGDEVIAADYTAFTPESSGTGWYEKPATLYAISKNTDHPKEAAILLNFLLNSKDMAQLQGVEKGIPISQTALNTLDKKGMLSGLQYEASEMMNSNDKLREMDPVLENNDIINDFFSTCNLVMYDKASLEEAASGFYTALNEKNLQ